MLFTHHIVENTLMFLEFSLYLFKWTFVFCFCWTSFSKWSFLPFNFLMFSTNFSHLMSQIWRFIFWCFIYCNDRWLTAATCPSISPSPPATLVRAASDTLITYFLLNNSFFDCFISIATIGVGVTVYKVANYCILNTFFSNKIMWRITVQISVISYN